MFTEASDAVVLWEVGDILAESGVVNKIIPFVNRIRIEAYLTVSLIEWSQTR